MSHASQIRSVSARRILGSAAACLAAATALAETRLVPSQFATIQAAINAAQPGDVVLVADGVYTGPGNVDLSFLGKSIVVRSSAGATSCIIDCDGTPANPHRGFAFQNGETAQAILDGFTIRRGATATGAVADPFNGAAILCNSNSSPTIRNCVLEENSAACWGGAMCATNASPTVINCVFRNNTVGDDGAAFFTWGTSTPRLINCLMANNVSGGTGGAITSFASANTIEVTNCTLIGNHALWGAAIYAFNIKVSNSILWGNTGSNFQIPPNSGAIVQYSNIQGGHAGAGNLDVEPTFVDFANGDFRLAPGSALIDAGNNSALTIALSQDVAGAARFCDDPGTADSGVGDALHAVIDIGAFEFTGNSCPGDTNADHQIDLADLAGLLSAFGTIGTSAATDVDRDGDVDVADLAGLLAAFGSSCD